MDFRGARVRGRLQDEVARLVHRRGRRLLRAAHAPLIGDFSIPLTSLTSRASLEMTKPTAGVITLNGKLRDAFLFGVTMSTLGSMQCRGRVRRSARRATC